MCLILNIESTSSICSVALSRNEELIALQEVSGAYTHAENLHLFIQNVMVKGKVKFEELSAIAISQGPGSYTGLRIGSSTAKGLAYALKKPLIAVDTLLAMSSSLWDKHGQGSLYVPCIDARRMEIYTAIYSGTGEEILRVNAMIVDEQGLDVFRKGKDMVFFGSGMNKCRTLFSSIEKAHFAEGVQCSAAQLVQFALKKFNAKEFVDPAYFEPLYLKEFYTPIGK